MILQAHVRSVNLGYTGLIHIYMVVVEEGNEVNGSLRLSRDEQMCKRSDFDVMCLHFEMKQKEASWKARLLAGCITWWQMLHVDKQLWWVVDVCACLPAWGHYTHFCLWSCMLSYPLLSFFLSFAVYQQRLCTLFMWPSQFPSDSNVGIFYYQIGLFSHVSYAFVCINSWSSPLLTLFNQVKVEYSTNLSS